MFDSYQFVTDRIIAELEKGKIPWQKPWIGSSDCVSHVTGKAYSLLNQLMIGEPGEFISFKQCVQEGGHVRKGSKSRKVCYWQFLKRTRDGKDGRPTHDANGNEIVDTIPFLKIYDVFNVSDCEGIEAKWLNKTNTGLQPVEAAEAVLRDYLTRSGVSFENTLSNRAFYRPSDDSIHLPLITQFVNAAEYYGTAFHEASHSTGHASRLNRLGSSPDSSLFGSESYSKEELVAEISSCAILNRIGLETQSSFRNNVAYVQSWLKALKDDKRLLVTASSQAAKAAALILNDKEGETNE